MRRFLLLFFLIQAGLFIFELSPIGQQFLVQPWTQQVAALSAWLMQVFDSSVLAQDIYIYNAEQSFGIAIRPGCNGIEAGIILAAAVFAFPKASMQQRLLGFSLGFLTVQVLNLVRIISLFYLGQWHAQWFEWAHLYLWEVLIMLDVLIVFLIWVRRLPSASAQAATA